MVTERLLAARQQAGLSQNKVAEALNISQQQYCRYENGQNEIPVRYVVALCKFYDISADWLLGLKDTTE